MESGRNSQPTLFERIQSAIDEAHRVSELYGPDSPESAAAWDVVEELQAEAAHQKDHPGHFRNLNKSFADYCEEYPEAPEARIYDS
jgi:hypothetical protein